jgi:hypothetical protein
VVRPVAPCGLVPHCLPTPFPTPPTLQLHHATGQHAAKSAAAKAGACASTPRAVGRGLRPGALSLSATPKQNRVAHAVRKAARHRSSAQRQRAFLACAGFALRSRGRTQRAVWCASSRHSASRGVPLPPLCCLPVSLRQSNSAAPHTASAKSAAPVRGIVLRHKAAGGNRDKSNSSAGLRPATPQRKRARKNRRALFCLIFRAAPLRREKVHGSAGEPMVNSQQHGPGNPKLGNSQDQERLG